MSNKIKAENSESAAKTKKVRGKPFEKVSQEIPVGERKYQKISNRHSENRVQKHLRY